MRRLLCLPLALAAAVLGSTPADASPRPRDDLYSTRQAASTAAGTLGCSGAHAMGSGFRPCADGESYRKARQARESGHHGAH